MNVTSSGYFFLNHLDWFVKEEDKKSNLGKRIGTLSIGIPTYHPRYETDGKYEILSSDKTYISIECHENMKMIYCMFDKIIKNSEFSLSIWDEISQTFIQNILSYTRSSIETVSGIFIPMDFMLNNNGRVICMGNQVFNKWMKYKECMDELKNHT